MRRAGQGQSRERVYRFVREAVLRGAPPTTREVQRACGFRAVQSARQHLEALVAEGRLVKERGQARGYRLPGGGGRGVVMVPLLGRVPAGPLETAIEDLEGWLPVPARAAGAEMFALRVRGDSMVGAGILPGDVVIVRRQVTADPGDIVVALVDDEATVKRLRVGKDGIALVPENPAHAPIRPDPGDLRILGRVIEVRRSLVGEWLEVEPDVVT